MRLVSHIWRDVLCWRHRRRIHSLNDHDLRLGDEPRCGTRRTGCVGKRQTKKQVSLRNQHIFPPGTNLFQLGLEETCDRIHKMVSEASDKAGITKNKKLRSLGLALSGCEREETNRELEEMLMKRSQHQTHQGTLNSYNLEFCTDIPTFVIVATPLVTLWAPCQRPATKEESF